MGASLLESLLPAEVGLRIDAVALESSTIVVEASTTSTDAPCPRCHHHSTTRYGRYQRHLRDQPCRGWPLRLTLSAWQYVCPRPDCPQRLFCERLTGLARAQARTTTDLDHAHRSIGLALGGAAGAWLAANPQVEVITRDRWPAYIRAATEAAPQAKQVADRFHLLINVREAVEK